MKVLSLEVFCIVLCSLIALGTSEREGRFFYRNDIDLTKEEGRIFFSTFGDMISSSSIFPITINVPDVFSTVGSYMGSVYDYFFGSEETSDKPGQTPRIWDFMIREMDSVLSEI